MTEWDTFLVWKRNDRIADTTDLIRLMRPNVEKHREKHLEGVNEWLKINMEQI